MTSIEQQFGGQEAVTGLAALVGDADAGNARVPSQAASAFGALLGALGQEAAFDAAGSQDGPALFASKGDGQAEPEQLLPEEPAAQPTGDVLMRAMWPAWPMTGSSAAAGHAVADAVPPPVSLSLGQAAPDASVTDAQAEPHEEGAATQTTGAADALDAQAPRGPALKPQTPPEPALQTAESSLRPTVQAAPQTAAMPRATASDAQGSAPDADDAPSGADSADSVMARQRAAYAQAMAMPLLQRPNALPADEAPFTVDYEGQADGAADTQGGPAALENVVSAPSRSFLRSVPAQMQAAAAGASPPQGANQLALAGQGAKAQTAAQAAEAQAAAAQLAAAGRTEALIDTRMTDRPGAGLGDGAPKGDAADSADSDDSENALASAEAAGASSMRASFFPASMMPAPAQPAPAAAAPVPDSDNSFARPHFDAASAFERGAQARSLSRAPAVAQDAEVSKAEAEAEAPQGTSFQQALQASQTQSPSGPEAASGVHAAQAPSTAPVPREAVSQELAQAITQGAGRVQMRIVPEGLGELDIKVQMTGQQVHLTIRGDAPELAQLLSHKVHELRQDLQSQGLTLEAMDFGALASGTQSGSFAQNARSGGDSLGSGRSGSENQGELQRLAGSKAPAAEPLVRRAPRTGPSHRTIDVVL